ncbi:YdcF family protein [Myxococcota bacterium]|nr:YdcF family protein [Myxococcota bacterium]
MPTVVIWLGLGASAVYFLGARRWRASIFPALAFVVYGLGGNISVSAWVLDVFIRELPPAVPVSDLPELDAVFVLGGGAIFPYGTRDPTLTRWGNRITVAAEVQRAGKTRYLVASGGQGDSQTEATAILWRRLGVPDDAILQIPRGDITREELLEYRKMITERGFRKVALLSSAYHMPRAMKKARELGMDLYPIAVDRPWPAPEHLDERYLVPIPDAWVSTEMVLRELLGMAVGR